MQPNGDFLGQYKELARLMYEVRRVCPRLSVLATPSVHPRHPLPADHFKLISDLAARGGADSQGQHVRLPSLHEMVKRWLWTFLLAARDVVRILGLRFRFRKFLREITSKPAFLIMKTWCFGPKSLDGPEDFYYGKLPKLLQERGLSTVLLCGDYIGGDEKDFARAVFGRRDFRSVPERLLIPFWAPLLTAWDQILGSVELRRLARNSADQKFALVCAHGSLDCITPAARQNAMYFYIARTAVRWWGPKAFVTLYEGQPWEKPAWRGAKAGSQDCLIVGYQHAVIMPHSLSVLSPNINPQKVSAPEIVLCLGQTTKKMMAQGHRSRGTQLIPFGSFRRALSEPLQDVPIPERRTVLVVPEAVPLECELLFNFALRAAPLLPDHRFILRCHPALPFAAIRGRLERAPEDLPNVEISSRKFITDDLSCSSVALYRGSSSVLSAILHGLKPIYLHDERYPDVDPIFQLNGWKEQVSSEEELERILRRYAVETKESAASQWRSAWDYVNNYAMPVDRAAVDRFLAEVGVESGAGAP